MVLSEQDIVLLDNFSTITNSNFGSADFDDKKFMVTTVPSSTTITITMPSNESGSGATTSGGIRVQHYYPVGPAVQAKGFGWSLGSWGGEVALVSLQQHYQVLLMINNNRYYISRRITVSRYRYKLYKNRNRRNILHRYKLHLMN